MQRGKGRGPSQAVPPFATPPPHPLPPPPSSAYPASKLHPNPNANTHLVHCSRRFHAPRFDPHHAPRPRPSLFCALLRRDRAGRAGAGGEGQLLCAVSGLTCSCPLSPPSPGFARLGEGPAPGVTCRAACARRMSPPAPPLPTPTPPKCVHSSNFFFIPSKCPPPPSPPAKRIIRPFPVDPCIVASARSSTVCMFPSGCRRKPAGRAPSGTRHPARLGVCRPPGRSADPPAAPPTPGARSS